MQQGLQADQDATNAEIINARGHGDQQRSVGCLGVCVACAVLNEFPEPLLTSPCVSICFPSWWRPSWPQCFCSCAAKPSRTAQIERRLAASGFQVMPATTPKQLELVSQLDPNSLTLMTRNGKQYYVFPRRHAEAALHQAGMAQYPAISVVD